MLDSKCWAVHVLKGDKWTIRATGLTLSEAEELGNRLIAGGFEVRLVLGGFL